MFIPWKKLQASKRNYSAVGKPSSENLMTAPKLFSTEI